MKEVMRVGKVKAAAVHGIQKENNRTEADKGSFPLSEIDWSRTWMNIPLVRCGDWEKGIRAVLDEHGVNRIRKDAVMLVQAVYSASPAFFDGLAAEVRNDYFQRCVEFHRNHYGNVLNAVIHLDEKTPHLHVVSVPLVQRDGGSWSLSARDLLGSREGFRQRMTAFHLEVGRDFDLERGESGDPAVKKAHQEAWEYRVETLQLEADALRGEIWGLEMQRDKVAADLDDKVTLQGLAAWAEGIMEKIHGLISGISDFLEKLLGKIENRAVLLRDDLARASCRMKGIIYNPTGERYKFPVTKDGDPLTWAGQSPLYVKDGERYYPVDIVYQDGAIYPVQLETFSPDNRDPAAVDFMDRLESVSVQLEAFSDALDKADLDSDPVDRKEPD